MNNEVEQVSVHSLDNQANPHSVRNFDQEKSDLIELCTEEAASAITRMYDWREMDAKQTRNILREYWRLKKKNKVFKESIKGTKRFIMRGVTPKQMEATEIGTLHPLPIWDMAHSVSKTMARVAIRITDNVQRIQELAGQAIIKKQQKPDDKVETEVSLLQPHASLFRDIFRQIEDRELVQLFYLKLFDDIIFSDLGKSLEESLPASGRFLSVQPTAIYLLERRCPFPAVSKAIIRLQESILKVICANQEIDPISDLKLIISDTFRTDVIVLLAEEIEQRENLRILLRNELRWHIKTEDGKRTFANLHID